MMREIVDNVQRRICYLFYLETTRDLLLCLNRINYSFVSYLFSLALYLSLL